jgi:hypothetical protein
MLKQAMGVKPAMGIKKQQVEIIADGVMAVNHLLVNAGYRSKKQFTQKAQPGRKAQLVGKLPAHVKDGHHIAVKIKIAIHIGLAERKLVDGTPQQSFVMHGDTETGIAFTGCDDPAIGQLNLAGNTKALKEPFKPAGRGRAPRQHLQFCFLCGLGPWF